MRACFTDECRNVQFGIVQTLLYTHAPCHSNVHTCSAHDQLSNTDPAEVRWRFPFLSASFLAFTFASRASSRFAEAVASRLRRVASSSAMISYTQSTHAISNVCTRYAKAIYMQRTSSSSRILAFVLAISAGFEMHTCAHTQANLGRREW
jgi:hypothetical protein